MTVPLHEILAAPFPSHWLPLRFAGVIVPAAKGAGARRGKIWKLLDDIVRVAFPTARKIDNPLRELIVKEYKLASIRPDEDTGWEWVADRQAGRNCWRWTDRAVPGVLTGVRTGATMAAEPETPAWAYRVFRETEEPDEPAAVDTSGDQAGATPDGPAVDIQKTLDI